jgi:hypothetical protein
LVLPSDPHGEERLVETAHILILPDLAAARITLAAPATAVDLDLLLLLLPFHHAGILPLTVICGW